MKPDIRIVPPAVVLCGIKSQGNIYCFWIDVVVRSFYPKSGRRERVIQRWFPVLVFHYLGVEVCNDALLEIRNS